MTIDKKKLQSLLWSEVAAWKADCAEWKRNAEALQEFLGEKTVEEVALELLAENEALRKRIDDMSPFKGAPLTGPTLKCMACGDYHYGLGGLPCPKMRVTAQALSMENQRIKPVEPLRIPHPLDAAMSKVVQP